QATSSGFVWIGESRFSPGDVGSHANALEPDVHARPRDARQVGRCSRYHAAGEVVRIDEEIHLVIASAHLVYHHGRVAQVNPQGRVDPVADVSPELGLGAPFIELLLEAVGGQSVHATLLKDGGRPRHDRRLGTVDPDLTVEVAHTQLDKHTSRQV